MEEILKNICNKSLERAYEQTLKSTFTSFFYKNYKEHDVEYVCQCDPDIYIKEVAIEILESFISNDFTVSKITSDFTNVNAFTNSIYGNAITSANIDVVIYNILEKDLNIIILNDYCNDLVNIEEDVIEEYLEDLCEVNNEQYSFTNQSEIYRSIISAKDFLLFYPNGRIIGNKFQYKPYKFNKSANLQYILISLYGENQKTNTYQNIIEKYMLDLNKIIKMELSEIYNKNKELFLQTVLPIFIKKATIKLHTKEQQIIYNYLSKNKNIDKIIQLIFTFQYTSRLNHYVTFNEHMGFANVLGFLDFSFVAVQMFKLVEIVFYDLLNDFWKTNNIRDKYGSIDVSDDKINLGKMNQFFKSNDNEIVNHLNLKRIHNDRLQEKLSKWIDETRNGFLHKHILSKSLSNISITDSIDIVCLLILVLIK